jgi:hypothetical protein
MGYMDEIKMLDKRPFNRGAYNETDSKAKNKIIEIMKRLDYFVCGDPEEENFKKYDLKFYNKNLNKFLSIENEVRRDFETIRDKWDTVHIPIRKQNTRMSFYFVWNSEVNQAIVISREVFLKHRSKSIIDVDCDTEYLKGERIGYSEKFIDIPKNECKLYFVGQNYRMIEGIMPD